MKKLLDFIPITDIQPIRIGQVENKEAATGCTVLICEDGMAAGLDVRGGGPASRESQLLNPLMAAQTIHAIVLSGGSAYGLGTANGVMEYLEEHGYGFDTGFALVPLVAQADIYDLSVGDPSVRPDAAMGYEAAKKAFEDPNYRDGNYGVGCGATVGKLAGMDYCMKSGIGSASRLSVGSPVPIITRWVRRCGSSRRALSRTICSRISPRERFRTKPSSPLAQNRHPMAHPTWVLIQPVRWFRSSRRRTASTRCPSGHSIRIFLVPSSEVVSATKFPEKTVFPNRFVNLARSGFEMSVISSNESILREKTQRRT